MGEGAELKVTDRKGRRRCRKVWKKSKAGDESLWLSCHVTSRYFVMSSSSDGDDEIHQTYASILKCIMW